MVAGVAGPIAAALLAGCGASPAPPAPKASPTPGARHLAWMLTTAALRELGGMAQLRPWLRGDRLYVVLPATAHRASVGSGAIATVSYPSFLTLASAVAAGSLPQHLKAVVFDPERWSFTPAPEQAALPAYESRFVRLARAHGLLPILAPAQDLVRSLDPTAPSQGQGYLDLHLARSAASALRSGPGAVELQTQSLERSPRAYLAFVRSAVAQIRRISPRVEVLAGLSTNPPGAPVTLAQLRSDVTLTRGLVVGYWLNVPLPGPFCPTCAPADPGLGTALLKGLAPG